MLAKISEIDRYVHFMYKSSVNHVLPIVCNFEIEDSCETKMYIGNGSNGNSFRLSLNMHYIENVA